MNPSLLLIPDRYKASKLYSQIPDSGAGDLAFTRANDTATRVNSQGLIEKVRTNIATHSEDFTNAAWVANAAPTITANTTVAPNGTTTADTIASTGANSGVYQVPSVSAGTPYAFSVYIKNISSATAISIGCDLNPINGTLVFNAVSGTITSVGAGITASSVTNEGNGWYRVFGTYVATGSPNTFLVFGGGVMSFAVWGAMFQAGDILTPYIPTTTAAVSVGPVADIPRIDYTGGGCGKLLLEPQRTNRAQFSEQFNNAYWTKSGATISANAAVSPDGFQNADKLVEDAGVVTPSFFRSSIAGANVVHTNSIYAKAGERIWLVMNIGDGVNSARAWFNLSAGVIGTVNAGLTAQIQDAGNGWYRCIITRSVVTFGSSVIEYQIATSDGVEGYTGNGTSGLFIYGVQFEAGSYVSSYIPTLGASVTRSADAASKTGISSLIGQTQGTLFAEWTCLNANQSGRILALSDGGFANRIAILEDAGTIRLFISTSSVTQADLTNLGSYTGTHKIAVAYANNDLKVYIDGVAVATVTTLTVPACSATFVGTLEDGSNATALNGGIAAAALYPIRLSNAQLQTLTTL